MSLHLRGALLTMLLACAAASQALASIQASLDNSQIAAGDTVQLTLEHDGSSSGQPDLSPLQQDFDILGTSSSTSVQIGGGGASEKTEIVLTLAPKVTGHVTIPALTWDGERTQPLSLLVTGPGASSQQSGAASNAARLFIETSATPEQPYVQAAVTLTVQLYAAETLYHADLELPESGDVIAKQVGSDENSEVQRSGQTYQVITRHYVLFPLHSGKIVLPSPVLEAQVAVNSPQSPFGSNSFGGNFFGSPAFGMLRTVRPVRVHGNPITLSVRPRPAGAVGNYWLPAQAVELTASWNPTQLAAQAGDPITVDLNLQATGLSSAQLPDLSTLLRLPPGLKAYPDQAKLDDAARNGAVVGSRDQTIALMASTAGHYTIPPLSVSWWDTQTHQPRVAALPARTLTIVPPAASAQTSASSTPAATPASTATTASPSGAAPAGAALASAAPRHTPPNSASAPSPWKWISIGLAIAWLSTVGIWIGSRRPRTPRPESRPTRVQGRAPDASQERAAFRAACETNDAHAARVHLLAWAAALWGLTPPGVGAIAARIGDPAVADLLRDLDRACYAGGEWRGAALAAALTELPRLAGKTTRDRDGLAPLYP